MSTWNFSINTVCHVCGGTILLLLGFAAGNLTKEPKVVEAIQYVEKEPEVIRETVEIPVPKVVEVHHVEKVDRIPQVTLSQGEKELIAKVVFAEAAYEDSGCFGCAVSRDCCADYEDYEEERDDYGIKCNIL